MSYSSQCKGKLTFDGLARSRPASRRRPARHRRAAGGCARQGRPDRQAAHGATLTYDADSRLAQTTGSTTTRFLYEGSQIVAEYNSSGVIQRRFVPGPAGDEPIVWYEGSGSSDRRWLLADRQGSVIAVANSAGTTIGINTYDESGVPGGSNLGRFQYTGQAFMPEIGLYNYKARMYAPSLGRFMQTDPIGYADGMNWYNYVHGNPVNGTDPTGTDYFLDEIVVTCCTFAPPQLIYPDALLDFASISNLNPISTFNLSNLTKKTPASPKQQSTKTPSKANSSQCAAAKARSAALGASLKRIGGNINLTGFGVLGAMGVANVFQPETIAVDPSVTEGASGLIAFGSAVSAYGSAMQAYSRGGAIPALSSGVKDFIDGKLTGMIGNAIPGVAGLGDAAGDLINQAADAVFEEKSSC